jgi:hypothetical protein
LSSAAFGFGGVFEKLAAFEALSSPVPVEPGAAFGTWRVVTMSAPLT